MDRLATDWIEKFPGLAQLPEDLRRDLRDGSEVIRVPAGTEIFAPGNNGDRLLMLLDGTVRVQQKSDTGREVALYRVNAGDSCVLSNACMLAFEDHAAEGTAESDVTAVAIPAALFDSLLARSKVFRDFVFRAYSKRMTDLFAVIDDIVFQKMDVRLAQRLLELADGAAVKATHQTLANELGTAREVISRTLQEFHRRGWIEQSRGTVHITDREGLERLARSSSGF